MNRSPFYIFLFAFPVLGLTADEPEKKIEDQDRAQFVKNMLQVRKGMSREQVVGILGDPDEIRYLDGMQGKQWMKLCYGSSGKGTFPTLGQVFMPADGTTTWHLFGDHGTPPAADVISEAELRKALRSIDKVPLLRPYDPRQVIKTVNLLQGLGHRKAMAAIREYLRVSSYYDHGYGGSFFILRVLFDIPDDVPMPIPTAGRFWPAPPPSLRDFPRYPLLLVDDIPFCIAYRYMLAGYYDPWPDVNYFDKFGRFRAKPLKPAKDPMAVVERLNKNGLPYYGKTSSLYEIDAIMRQLEAQAEMLLEK